MQAIAVLSLLPDHIKNGINQLRAFGIMTLSPVVSGTRLTENEIVRPENLTVGSRSNAVHGTGFKIHENSPGNKPTTTGFVVVDIDPLKLKLGVSLVPSGGIDAMLGTDNLPELGSDLVAALASLNVKNLTHFGIEIGEQRKKKRVLRETGGLEKERER